MVTVGRGLLDAAARDCFDGFVTYDVDKAVARLADDALFDTPWNEPIEGKDAIHAFLVEFLGAAGNRPSFSIIDLGGDGAIHRIIFSESGQGGRSPKRRRMDLLVLEHVIHQIVVTDATD